MTISGVYNSAMASASKRFQPYHGKDGDYIRLLDFAHAAGQVLDPGFSPPKVMLSKDESEGMQDRMHSNKRWGNEAQGFETLHTIELEPRASGHAVDRVELKTFGLAEGASLELEVTRYWYDPRFAEIRVSGPEEAVRQVLADFEEQFGGTQMEPEKLKERLVSAEVSLKAGAWEAAIMKAEEVLKLDESQPEAYFVIGSASMATGELEKAVENLTRAVELAPEHAHGWFNLGKVYEQRGDLEEALGAYQKVLANPPVDDANFMEAVMAAIGALMKKIGGG